MDGAEAIEIDIWEEVRLLTISTIMQGGLVFGPFQATLNLAANRGKAAE